MFISKEKYAAAQEKIAGLEKALQDKDQQVLELQLREEELLEKTSDPTCAQEELKSQVESLTATVKDLQDEREKLTQDLTEKQKAVETANETIEDLLATVEKLNSEAACPSAQAISQSDAPTGGDSLLHFVAHNQDNTIACVERLKQAGF